MSVFLPEMFVGVKGTNQKVANGGSLHIAIVVLKTLNVTVLFKCFYSNIFGVGDFHCNGTQTQTQTFVAPSKLSVSAGYISGGVRNPLFCEN